MPATLADIQRKYGESVYPLYKSQMHEPYMENDTGIGCHGVVMYNERKDKVQCSICGKFWSDLGHHLKSHKTSTIKYKEKFGLYKKTALCSKKRSRIASETGKANGQKHLIPVKGGDKMPSEWRKSHLNACQGMRKTAQFQNLNNLCRAQIVAQLIVVAKATGKAKISDITKRELRAHNLKLYQTLWSRFKSVKKMCQEMGIADTSTKYFRDIDLISFLRKFVKEQQRLPKTTDLKKRYGLSDYGTYKKYFGSWRRATTTAGLDQLLEEVKNK